MKLTRADIPASVTFIDKTAFYNDPNLTLGVYYDSYAHHYAIDNNIPYVLLDGVKLGDVNGDGAVNVNDVTDIQKHIAHILDFEGLTLKAADANGDGVVNIIDVTAIQKYIANYELPYPIGEPITQ